MDPCMRRCRPDNSLADGLYASSRLRDTRTEIDAISSCFRSILLLPLFFLERRASPTYHFFGIVNRLNHRTTNKPADETLAVFGLLGVAKLLADGDTEGRLRTLLLKVRTLSATIISGGSPRMRHASFRRAPRTLSSVRVLGSMLGVATCI
ncbi:hypothetical protein K466DRAFT_602468 [Polyporus arcularius HHB13444]|uniref:Uncharacterized protein n=1 Tax=Polyporus arcularius HHB13444 TaxID=1314778 RepID=A0A5C3P2N9_9APHY|nr:hypothetical protein K466DRAFT_602468 [Polyporus arcularius HHB13444]